MPTLDWMGKDKVVDYYHQVPYRILERVPAKGLLDSHGSDCGNMVIHGDNLEALKALLPEYEGQVDCIYIDPLSMDCPSSCPRPRRPMGHARTSRLTCAASQRSPRGTRKPVGAPFGRAACPYGARGRQGSDMES